MTRPDPADMRPGALRADLQTSDQTQRGRRFTVIKSPLTLTYFRLPSEHYAAAREFNGKRTLGEVTTLLESHPYWRSLPKEEAISELSQLATQLAGGGLLHLPGTSATARSRHIHAQVKRRKLEQIVGKVLYFRKPLIDPDKLLAKILPCFSWVYTRTAGWSFLILLILTAWMLLDNREELSSQAVNFFTLSNLFLSWILFMGVKIIHEFGHGLTCKRYGGEVHEMGFLFILLTPYLYCDVSDSWMVASRARRVAVTAAGIAAELFLACMAAWLWHILQPGLGRQLCFNTMIICSVSTILFNANPLMKFDGYYIMTDLLEIPNLRQKGNSVVAGFFSRLLGVPPTREVVSEYEKSLLFGFYAVAAYLYGWWITFHIAAVVFDKLEPYGLGFLSRSYVGLFLFVSVALPAWRLAQGLRKNPISMNHFRTTQAKWALATFAALLLLLLLPWRPNIQSMAVIEFSTLEQITPGQAGLLEKWYVHEGERVTPGEKLAELTSPSLNNALNQAKLEKEADEVQWRAALDSSDEQIRLAASTWQKSSQEVGDRLLSLEEQISDLTVRSTQSGIVSMPQMDHLVGQYFSKGRLLLQIGDDRTFHTILPLSEKQARQVKPGDPVVVRLKAYPGRRMSGHLLTVPSSSAEEFSTPIMASTLGGDFPSEAGKNPGTLPRPAIPCYEAIAVLDPVAEPLRPGMTGKASIAIRPTRLGGWLGETLLDWLNPSLRL